MIAKLALTVWIALGMAVLPHFVREVWQMNRTSTTENIFYTVWAAFIAAMGVYLIWLMWLEG